MTSGVLRKQSPPLTLDDQRREMNARNQARAKGWSLHTINTSNGRRWLLVRTYHEGQEMELPYGQIEEIRRGELIFSLDALEDEIKEL